jgi:CarD family transcriptional regulator, regulator of rRNA transcription
MQFKVGSKVVYPSQGPCLIDALVTKVVAGQSSGFYRLTLLDGSGDAVLVASNKLKTTPIRGLITKSEIPKLLGHLENLPLASISWRQRGIDHARLLASGSAYDLAEIVGVLTELSEAKPLPSRDRQTLERAKKLLICEISEVTGETRTATEEKRDRVFNTKKSNPIFPDNTNDSGQHAQTGKKKRPAVESIR